MNMIGTNYILSSISVDTDDPKEVPSIEYLQRIKSLLTPLEEHLARVGMPAKPIIIKLGVTFPLLFLNGLIGLATPKRSFSSPAQNLQPLNDKCRHH